MCESPQNLQRNKNLWVKELALLGAFGQCPASFCMFPVVLALWWLLLAALTWFSFPSLPYQNTSELEGGGDSHQSSINTLPDISLVRHGAVLLHLRWELEILMIRGFASASVAFCYIDAPCMSQQSLK